MNAFNSSSYCKDAGKAVINYRPYISDKIRYRYKNEDWQVIEADDFTLEQTSVNDETHFPRYFITFEATVNGRFPKTGEPVIFKDGQTIRGISTTSHGNIEFLNTEIVNREYRLNCRYLLHSRRSKPNTFEDTTCYYYEYGLLLRCAEPENNQTITTSVSDNFAVAGTNLRNFGYLEDTNNPPLICYSKVNKCVFTATRCGEIVHQETREECPEIEQIDQTESGLNEEKSITVNSIPKDYYIEVNSFAYFINNGTSKSVSKISIPPHCLNIYKVDGTFFNPAAKSNNSEHPLQLIAQVCSAKYCPPPQVDVICLPPDKCPPGTCEVQCGARTCCYDNNGISVFSFLK